VYPTQAENHTVIPTLLDSLREALRYLFPSSQIQLRLRNPLVLDLGSLIIDLVLAVDHLVFVVDPLSPEVKKKPA
jgi:hypothetical protein